MDTSNQGLFQKIIAASPFGAGGDSSQRFIREDTDFQVGFEKGNICGQEHGYLDGYANTFGETHIKMHMAKCCSDEYISGHRAGYDSGYDTGFIRGLNDRQHDFQFSQH